MQGDFFTIESLGTLAGASAATLATGNSIQYVFNANPRWLALAAAEFICLGLVAVLQIDGGTAFVVTPYFVALLNGFLVFCSAAGLVAIGDKARRGGRTARFGPNEPRAFWTPWF